MAFIGIKQLPDFPIIRRISFSTPVPERARMVAELQELYGAVKFEDILARVEACLPKDEAGNFIPDQEKSDVVHDLLAYLAKKMQEMNPARSKFEKQLAKEKTQAEKSPAKLKRPEFACEADARKEEN